MGIKNIVITLSPRKDYPNEFDGSISINARCLEYVSDKVTSNDHNHVAFIKAIRAAYPTMGLWQAKIVGDMILANCTYFHAETNPNRVYEDVMREESFRVREPD